MKAKLIIGALFCSLAIHAQEGSQKITPSFKAFLADSFRLFDIFPLEKVIRIQDSEDFVARADDLAFIGDRIYLLDRLQRMVFEIDWNGRILRRIGALGRGPGEYQNPSKIQQIWGKQLAIYDGMNQLLVYNGDGEHQFTLNGRVVTIPRSEFDWSRKDRMYATYFRITDQNAKIHRILDYTDLKNPVHVRDFEDKSPAENHLKIPFIGSAFCIVEDTVWSAVKHEGEIHVFDLDGKKLRNISLKDPKALKVDDYEKAILKHKDITLARRELSKEFVWVSYINYVGGLVIVTTNRGFVVFDTDGDRLSPTLLFETVIRGVHGDRIFTPLEFTSRDEDEAVYTSSLSEEYNLMKALGFDFDNNDDSVYLRVGKLKR